MIGHYWEFLGLLEDCRDHAELLASRIMAFASAPTVKVGTTVGTWPTNYLRSP